MRLTLTILLFCLASEAGAQQTISGMVTDRKGNPVTGANLFFEGSYEGAISNLQGVYTLTTDLTGKQLFIASFIGFERKATEIVLANESIHLDIVLQEEANALNEVVITAGVFSAGDKKKSATLNSFDIATTPSAMGDIYGAYATMPGSQKVGEEGMLFVRGGESYETKTYMDGMLVRSPYFSKTTDIPTRGRFSPLLFSETSFSTGGYSGEYGQALSSVVDLTTNGLETSNKASVSIMTAGANASLSRRFKNSSLSVSGMYVNSALQNKLAKQRVDWVKNPELGDLTLMYRQTLGETGMLKVFCSYNNNSMQMNYENFEEGRIEKVKLTNHSLYSNASYTGQLSEKWLIRSGFANSQDLEWMRFNDAPISTTTRASDAKLVLTNLLTEKIKIRIGGNVLSENYRQEIHMDTVINLKVSDLQPSAFIESELKLSHQVALRIGARAEYSTVLEAGTLSPRISAAFKTGSFSQLSLAWGTFSQKPGNDYLKFYPSLQAENSMHYILNYQYKKDMRMLRVEAYTKSYTKLVKFREIYSAEPDNYNNQGNGFARGLDVFWRDQKTLQGNDYWISYSFLDTRRDYRDYPHEAEPSFASKHNLSAVYKQFIRPISTFIGINYSFASGRPYNDKNSSGFMTGRTKPYNDISMNLSYITRLFQKDAVLHMSITNVLGFKNVYGYRFSNSIGEDGRYASRAVLPTAGRQAILVLLISL